MDENEIIQNAELKAEFYKNHIPKYILQHVRKMFQDVEKELGYDFLYADLEEAKESIVKAGIYKKTDLDMLLKYLKKYVTFGAERGLCDKFSNGFYILVQDDIPIVNQAMDLFISGPEQLYKDLSARYDFDGNGVVDGVGLHFVPPAAVMAWCGIYPPNEVLQDDVDVEAHTVRGVKIPDILWPIIDAYNENEVGDAIRGGYVDKVHKLQGKTFLRCSSRRANHPEITANTLIQGVNVAFRTEKFMQPKNLYIAGFLYRAAQIEKNRQMTGKALDTFLRVDGSLIMNASEFRRLLDAFKEYTE